jgi:hypothetical protein
MWRGHWAWICKSTGQSPSQIDFDFDFSSPLLFLLFFCFLSLQFNPVVSRGGGLGLVRQQGKKAAAMAAGFVARRWERGGL